MLKLERTITMVNSDTLDEGVGFSILHPKFLEKKKKQTIKTRFGDAKLDFYNGTEYYNIPCKDCFLYTKHGILRGTQTIKLPKISFNRALNISGHKWKLKQDMVLVLEITFTLNSKQRYVIHNVK